MRQGNSLDLGRSFLYQPQDLIKLGSKEVESGEDPSIGTQVVLLHHFGVIDGIPDVNVCREGEVRDCWVQVEDVGLLVGRGVEVGIETLHEGGFA
jgi:hypothetical protein